MEYRFYTDKYFIYARQILEYAGINPQVTIRVFARGCGKIAGLNTVINLLGDLLGTNLSQIKIWVSRQYYYTDKTTLILLQGPLQTLLELETIYLGVLSQEISLANGYPLPNYGQITAKLQRLTQIYADIPIIYFGARHYHYKFDCQIAQAALKGGAKQTSTDNGSATIGKPGVGSMPHVLILAIAQVYGRENATLSAAKLFDKCLSPEIPRIILIDTFNQEITDSLAVATYFGKREFGIRVDTCGENLAESCSAYPANNGLDPSFRSGKGVTTELIINLRNALNRNGYNQNCKIMLSSGFGNEVKALAFRQAYDQYMQAYGIALFTAVGIGEIYPGIFCTADVCEIDGKSFAKVGRQYSPIYSSLIQVC